MVYNSLKRNISQVKAVKVQANETNNASIYSVRTADHSTP